MWFTACKGRDKNKAKGERENYNARNKRHEHCELKGLSSHILAARSLLACTEKDLRPTAPPQNLERFRIFLLPCGYIEEERKAETTLCFLPS